MGMSDRRKALRAKRKAAKEARMKKLSPGSESKYALKKRGVYPPNSPYRTGDFGRRMKKLANIPPLAVNCDEYSEMPSSRDWREALHG